MTLWNGSEGFGAPVFIADVPPWHPLGLLARAIGSWVVAPLAAILSALVLGWLLRSFGVRRGWIAAVAIAAAAGIALQNPGEAVLILGLLSSLAALELFARRTSRARWALALAAIALAILGTTSALLPWLAAIAAWPASGRIRKEAVSYPALAGALAAIGAAVLLTALWWLPAFSLATSPEGVEPVRGALRNVEEGEPARIVDLATAESSPFASPHLRTVRALAVDETGAWKAGAPFVDFLNIARIEGRGRRDENPGALPRFFAVRDYVVIRDSQEASNALLGVRNFRSGATVDHVPGKILRRGGLRPPRSETSEELTPALETRAVRIESFGEGRAALRIGDGDWELLVSSEAWWPGWRSYWNGERLPPVIVNAAFVGAFVPPGDGTLELRYRPDAFDDGLRTGALGLILLAGTLVWPWFQRVPDRERRPWRRPHALEPLAQSAASLARTISRHAAAAGWLLFLGYSVFLGVNGAAIAGGSDSSGYMNHARLLREGNRLVPLELPKELRLPQDDYILFLPLGFAPGPDGATIVPSYPPGVPFHVVALHFLGGWAVRFLGPLAGIASAALMYALARELGLERRWAFWSAAVLALFATLLMFAVSVMSDVVATAWSIAAILGAFRARGSAWWGVLAGAAFGVSVLVRPSQVLLAPALAVALGLRWRALLAFVLAGLPLAAIQVETGRVLWGGALRTGYGDPNALVSLDFFQTRFAHYSRWLAALFSPLIFPVGLAGLAVASVERARRAALALWFFAFFVFYSFYGSYETWWYTRFLLPAAPALILLAFLAARAGAERIPAAERALVLRVLLVIVLATEAIHAFDKRPWELGKSEIIYPRAVAMADARFAGKPIVLGMQLSGAFMYYRGETMVRWDMLTPDRFERVRANAAIAGRTWYALLEDQEVETAFRNAPGNWAAIGRSRDVTLYELRP
ncbi:MAG TPA: glycosyltransferase family 39 protein [Thermoanaerobaculia bacterium]|nr:glycosyltransferase family 39 protein [Thermoanaerobaculia bacterium]